MQFFATPQTVAPQVPPSMEFSRQENWSGLPFPPPEDLPNPGMTRVVHNSATKTTIPFMIKTVSKLEIEGN